MAFLDIRIVSSTSTQATKQKKRPHSPSISSPSRGRSCTVSRGSKLASPEMAEGEMEPDELGPTVKRLKLQPNSSSQQMSSHLYSNLDSCFSQNTPFDTSQILPSLTMGFNDLETQHLGITGPFSGSWRDGGKDGTEINLPHDEAASASTRCLVLSSAARTATTDDVSSADQPLQSRECDSLTSPDPSAEETDHEMQTANPASSRVLGESRRRVLMGPRADCEKCRNQTPGHWIHFEA